MKLPVKKRYLFPLLLIATYALGPQTDFPEFTGEIQDLTISLMDLDNHIAQKESQFDNIKSNNQSLSLIKFNKFPNRIKSDPISYFFEFFPMSSSTPHKEQKVNGIQDKTDKT